jgi:hypothetical protein
MKRCRFGIPDGRSRYVIYAVVLREHPHIVKLGRSMKWSQRRTAYDNWNLADGDGVLEWVAYCITEEYVDLNAVEGACIAAMGVRPYRGNEWFKSDLEHARAAIEGVLQTAQLSYTEF